MNIEAIREFIPATVRMWIYGLWVLAALIVGSVDAWTGGGAEWVVAANRVLEFLMLPIGVLAAVNTTPEVEYDSRH